MLCKGVVYGGGVLVVICKEKAGVLSERGVLFSEAKSEVSF